MEDLSTKATTLTDALNKVDKAKSLTDLQVREYLAESRKWETKYDDIATSKVKIVKDIIGLD